MNTVLAIIAPPIVYIPVDLRKDSSGIFVSEKKLMEKSIITIIARSSIFCCNLKILM